MEQSTTALLVMDMQASILGSFPGAPAFISNVAKAIETARKRQLPVIYVVVGFREGMPEITSRNIGFSAAKERMANASMEEWIKIHPDLAPLENDIVVTKRRISAFTGSDLEVVLRAQDIQHLVLTGIATSGVVLSTLREAADKDYQLTVIADCCADGDEEVHRVLTTKVFPRQAAVVALNEWPPA
ncbi:isochorismatase [Niabella ginsenosidivorans]|uniref:Isochorismatase n=1 Tax=Niabella ginsenosidivorans TaxID=1176587 RepID=A0A1A9I0C9_9BACT|nr:isochorismatase family cysteine hydrolase [Niabella ginsenosidivorans]ANH81098.1 isochorismatase [Niabella ginsenosidivorans]